ncbi:hypothetical protein D3C83_214280 [compost metagenome]
MGITDADLRVSDLAVGLDAHHFLGAKGPLVEVDRLHGVVDDQVRGRGLASGMDGSFPGYHGFSVAMN